MFLVRWSQIEIWSVAQGEHSKRDVAGIQACGCLV